MRVRLWLVRSPEVQLVVRCLQCFEVKRIVDGSHNLLDMRLSWADGAEASVILVGADRNVAARAINGMLQRVEAISPLAAPPLIVPELSSQDIMKRIDIGRVLPPDAFDRLDEVDVVRTALMVTALQRRLAAFSKAPAFRHKFRYAAAIGQRSVSPIRLAIPYPNILKTQVSVKADVDIYAPANLPG